MLFVFLLVLATVALLAPTALSFVQTSKQRSAATQTRLFSSNQGFIDVEVFNPTETLELKSELLALSAATGRGENANDAYKSKILSLVEALEQKSEIKDPSKSELVYGTWELVYASTYLFRSSPFFMAARAVCKEGAEADKFNWFCKQHREALAFTSIGSVKQIVTRETLTSEFETRVAVIPGLPLIVTGTIVSVADIAESDATSWTLFLDSVRIKRGTSNIPGLNLFLDDFDGLPSRSLGALLEDNVAGYSNPMPVFRSYYLDADMRISRDQDDNVFVYTKAGSSIIRT